MVVLISNDNPVLIVDGDTRRPVELARSGAVSPELVRERPVQIEHLHPVVAAIGDEDLAPLVAADPPRSAQLAVALAFRAEDHGRGGSHILGSDTPRHSKNGSAPPGSPYAQLQLAVHLDRGDEGRQHLHVGLSEAGPLLLRPEHSHPLQANRER